MVLVREVGVRWVRGVTGLGKDRGKVGRGGVPAEMQKVPDPSRC